MMPGLIYLASPYSDPDPAVREERFQQACQAAAALLRAGIHVFSPIAHTHPIAQYGLPLGWDFWEPYDTCYLEACSAMVILMLPGWETSVGIAGETRYMLEHRKPVAFVTLDDVLTAPEGAILKLMFSGVK